MKFTYLIVAGSIALMGCDEPDRLDGVEEGMPVQLTSFEVGAVQSGVKHVLINADSASFSETMDSRKFSDDLISVCGHLEAKDSAGKNTGQTTFFGAYNTTKEGFVPMFVGNPDIVDPEFRELFADTQDAYQTICKPGNPSSNRG